MKGCSALPPIRSPDEEPMTPRIRVLVADDHRDMLAAIVSVIEDDERFSVVATAATADEAVAGVLQTPVDLALLDVNMPGNGVAAARALADLPRPPVVVAISAQSGGGVVEEMLRAGAVGYVTKGRVGDGLPDLLARCADGEVVLATPSGAGALRAVLGSTQRV
jgi:two-component system nitrate/nitrite response regulator NarL